MRGILEALLRYPSLDLFAITKSSLVRRDTDLLAKLTAAGRPVGVGFSITTLDIDLAKKMEPQAALPAERLKAMRTLAEAGITVGLMLMPVVPGLTDSDASIGAVLSAAREHGASFARENVLHLRSEPRRRFLPWLAETYPALTAEYSRTYAEGPFREEAYRQVIRERFAAWHAKLGFAPYEMTHRQARKGEQMAFSFERSNITKQSE